MGAYCVHCPPEFFGGCSNFAEPGYRLSYSITKSLTSARDSADCEEQCLLSTRFACKIFAYKYGSSGYNNCELSDRDFRDIQIRMDLDPDSEWDVFERTRYSGEYRDQSSIYDSMDSVIVDRLSNRKHHSTMQLPCLPRLLYKVQI